MKFSDEEQLLFMSNLSCFGNFNHIFLSHLITVLKIKPSSDIHASHVFIHHLFRLWFGAVSPVSFSQREIGDQAVLWYTCQFLEMSSLTPLTFKSALRQRAANTDSFNTYNMPTLSTYCMSAPV